MEWTSELLEELRAYCCEEGPDTPALTQALQGQTAAVVLFVPDARGQEDEALARFNALCPGGPWFACGDSRTALVFLRERLARDYSVERAAEQFRRGAAERCVFSGLPHTEAEGVRLSYCEAVQAYYCNRFYLPCGGFREISGLGRHEAKPIRLIQLERAMCSDLDSQQGKNLPRLLREWFEQCRLQQVYRLDELRMAVCTLYAVFQWKAMDKLILNEVQVKPNIAFYELMRIQTEQELEEWFVQWARYTLAAAGNGRDDRQRQIAAALEYIDKHLATATAGGTAAYLYLTPSAFSTLFKQETGGTFQDRLVDLRMKRAAEMLRSGLPVREAARAVGYGDMKHFRELFRSRYQLTPFAYLRQQTK